MVVPCGFTWTCRARGVYRARRHPVPKACEMLARASLKNKPAKTKARSAATPTSRSGPASAERAREETPDTPKFSWNFGQINIAASSEDGNSISGHKGEQKARTMHLLSRRLPTKLEVGAADDPQEYEADRMAERVMRTPERLATGLAAIDAADTVQRKISNHGSAASEASMTAPPAVHDVLGSTGEPLDAGTRRFCEPTVGDKLGG